MSQCVRKMLVNQRTAQESISAKLKLEKQKAELLARAARLTQKQTLEKEEAILKAKKEQLEMEMAANTAKLSIIKGYKKRERERCTACATMEPGYTLS